MCMSRSLSVLVPGVDELEKIFFILKKNTKLYYGSKVYPSQLGEHFGPFN